jgi:ABC-type amino acid transport substrate-binding protein
VIALAALLWAAAAPAPLTCGAVTRPGIAEVGLDGVWRGRAVDMCRRVAARLGGAGAPIAFHSYDSLAALRRAAADRIAFLTRVELAMPTLGDALRAGPPVADDRQVLIVHATPAVHAPADLTGQGVCFIIGTRAEAALDRWAQRTGTSIDRMAFQEPSEMQDSYDVDRCPAMAIDAAEMSDDGTSRVLATIGSEPILAATPIADGEEWARVVASAVDSAPTNGTRD